MPSPLHVSIDCEIILTCKGGSDTKEDTSPDKLCPSMAETAKERSCEHEYRADILLISAVPLLAYVDERTRGILRPNLSTIYATKNVVGIFGLPYQRVLAVYRVPTDSTLQR